MEEFLTEQAERQRGELRRAKEAGRLDRETRDRGAGTARLLEKYRDALRQAPPEDAMDALRRWFRTETDARQELGSRTGVEFDNAFRFLEQALGDSQELVLFVTEITAGYDTSWFVEQFGCEAYFRHNKELLFDDTHRRLRDKILREKESGTSRNGSLGGKG